MKSIFERYFKKYDAWYDRNKFTYYSELETIRKALPKGGKNLEVGVGTGRFAAPLRIKYGVDPAENMLKIARRRGIDVRKGAGEHLPFKKATFDCVTIIITLSFVQNPEKVLKEANRVLKKDGKIIIGMIDRDSFLGKYYQKKRGIFYKRANLLNVKEVADLLTRTRFKKFSYWQTIFRIPDEMRSVHKTRKGFGKGGFVVIRALKNKAGLRK